MRKISVIVPIYYGEKYVEDIIQQIEVCKTYLKNEDSIELLFVNDAPDAPISSNWKAKSIDIVVINTDENVGIHGARLKGLSRSQGEYILFLDQDDKIKPEYFHSQLCVIKESDAVICKVIEAGKPYYSGDDSFEKMVCRDFIIGERNPIVSPGQALIRRNAIPTAWTENILKHNGADDWFLWLCMIAEDRHFVLNQDILYEHVVQDSNASANLVEMRKSEQEAIRIIEKNKIFGDNDFRLLIDGYLKMQIVQTEAFCFMKKLLNIKDRHDRLLDNWLYLRDTGTNFSSFFKKRGYRLIAIYGAGKLGRHLFYELEKENVEVTFGIDANSKEISFPIPLYAPDERMPYADAIVITVIDQYKEISDMLGKRMESVMIPLEEIVQELLLDIKDSKERI